MVAFIALRVVLPTALEWAIPYLAESRAGARASVGNVDLGLIAGEVTIEDLVVSLPSKSAPEPGPATNPDTTPTEGEPVERNGEPEEALLSLERFFVDLEWTDLLSGRIHLAELRLDGPTIRLDQRVDGSLELPVPPASDDGAAEDEADPATAPESAASDPAIVLETPTDVAGTDPAAEAGDDAEAPNEASESKGWEYALDRFELNGADVALKSRAVGAKVLRFSAARLGLEAISVGTDGIGLGDIDFAQPEIYVQHQWLMDLIVGGGQAEQPAAGAARSAAPAVNLEHLKIEGAAFTINTRRGPVGVAIRLSLDNAGTAPGHTFPVDVGLEIAGGSVALAGEVGLNPLSYEGGFAWKNLSVPPFLLLSYPALVEWLASCNAEGDFQIVFRADSGAGLNARGTSSIVNLSFAHPESGELAVEWDRMDLDLNATYPLFAEPAFGATIEIGTLDLTGPKFVYTNPPDALDQLLAVLAGETAEAPDASEPAAGESETEAITAAEPEPESEAPEPSAPASPSPALSIATLNIADGVLLYIDRSVSPTHETSVENLRTKVDGIELSPRLGAEQISLDGRIQKTGTFELRGGLLGDGGRLQFELGRLDLVSYRSLASGAGWTIDTGTSSLSTKLSLSGDRYDAENEIVLHDLSVSPEDPGAFSAAFGVPFDLALALLRDVSGDIRLKIPVAYDEKGVGVGIGSLIGSAIRRAIAGALLSPFKLVGGLLPGGGDKPAFDPIPFEAGVGRVESDSAKRLKAIAGLLRERPQLGVELRGMWNDADRPTLALAMLTEKAVSGDAFPEVEGGSFFARRRIAGALRKRADGEAAPLEPEDEALLERYVYAQEVPTERFRALADARREAAGAKLLELGAPPASVVNGDAELADSPGLAVALRLRDNADADGQSIP